jgi:ribosome-binding ATPase
MNLLTYKKFVYAANVTEDMMDIGQERLKEILGLPNDSNITVVAICAKLEAEMVEMSLEERSAFLEEMGLMTTGLDNLIKASYDALGLQYYFTSGEKETRAWTIPVGAT